MLKNIAAEFWSTTRVRMIRLVNIDISAHIHPAAEVPVLRASSLVLVMPTYDSQRVAFEASPFSIRVGSDGGALSASTFTQAGRNLFNCRRISRCGNLDASEVTRQKSGWVIPRASGWRQERFPAAAFAKA
jgi:hypothetical protein